MGVVADELDRWRLHTGRMAKKSTEGVSWKWSASEECSADNREGTAEKSDLLFVKGLGSQTRVGYSVVNSEYIAFHPHQCLPKYEIEYEMGTTWQQPSLHCHQFEFLSDPCTGRSHS